MKGIPNRPAVVPGQGLRHLGKRHYDELEIRTLRAEGLSAVRIKELLGCSLETITHALSPLLREVGQQQMARQGSRRRAYRAAPLNKLYVWSEYHYSIVERHQEMLDEIEHEIARRRRNAKA